MSQLFVAQAEPRGPSDSTLTFLVRASSHREAWEAARRAAKTGDGALVRDPHEPERLHARPLTPSTHTVKRVLAASPNKRGRPPKLTVDDLLNVAAERGLPRSVQRVLTKLERYA